jgi:CrcB protein
MERWLWIALGGALGTAARYGISLWTTAQFGPGFPVGTVLVNLVGCFGMGALMPVALALAWPETLRLALTVGFLGGFTTYSSFNYETTRLMTAGAATSAAINAGVTIIGGLIAGWAGLLCGRLVVGR